LFGLTSKYDHAFQPHVLYLSSALVCSPLYNSLWTSWRAIFASQQTLHLVHPSHNKLEIKIKKYISKLTHYLSQRPLPLHRRNSSPNSGSMSWKYISQTAKEKSIDPLSDQAPRLPITAAESTSSTSSHLLGGLWLLLPHAADKPPVPKSHSFFTCFPSRLPHGADKHSSSHAFMPLLNEAYVAELPRLGISRPKVAQTSVRLLFRKGAQYAC
jgi:hypothetical protein